ncbi:MAG: phosphoribosylanthranilate isomerase [Bacteroidaceae bacterium]|nr:phosphoribosylanthranilate isomerase [Bacteroidaceae bacterium]
MIIKVCGMRDPENIRAVEEKVKPDMMGFIFWKGSKRYVSEVPSYLPKCTRVGVFVNPTEEEVLQKVMDFGLNVIQLHGQESPDFCQSIKSTTGLPLIKAISIGEPDSSLFTLHSSLYEGIVDLFLFDTKCQTVGGSGQQFEWDILQEYKGNTHFLLSGGIGPGDEEKVRRWCHPKCIGIDLNSRFEIAPALKDVEALAKFKRLAVSG